MSERHGKYNAKRTEVDGFVFASRHEANRYSELKLMESAGEITHLGLQPKFPIFVAGNLICTYIADFEYRTKSGTYVVEDAKGVKTDVYRLKNKLVRALYGVVIVEV